MHCRSRAVRKSVCSAVFERMQTPFEKARRCAGYSNGADGRVNRQKLCAVCSLEDEGCSSGYHRFRRRSAQCHFDGDAVEMVGADGLSRNVERGVRHACRSKGGGSLRTAGLDDVASIARQCACGNGSKTACDTGAGDVCLRLVAEPVRSPTFRKRSKGMDSAITRAFSPYRLSFRSED